MNRPPPLQLKRREERRLRVGHLWVFSNEVDTAATPLKNFAPGALATVTDSRGGALGLATVNPAALICARLLTRDPQARIDAQWFEAPTIQLDVAYRRRYDLCPPVIESFIETHRYEYRVLPWKRWK